MDASAPWVSKTSAIQGGGSGPLIFQSSPPYWRATGCKIFGWCNQFLQFWTACVL